MTAMMLHEYLQEMVDQAASDLYLTTGAPPSLRVQGQVTPLAQPMFQAGQVDAMAVDIMSDDQHQHYQVHPEMNLALSITGLGRFRVNVFRQRGETAMVIRHIQGNIPDLHALGAPDVLKQLMGSTSGLLLLVGSTGSGKSTTAASLLAHRNHTTRGHVVTIEDPIEFIHKHDQSIINQREVGVDTLSYDLALKNVLRQAPDVIYIGEIRSREAMAHALNYAQTGHLCLSTLHANNANQAVERIVNFFPKDQRSHVLFDLAAHLKAMVSQRLIPTLQAGQRVAAFEVMINTPLIADLIQNDRLNELKEAMQKSMSDGMCTFDEALLTLQQRQIIATDQALAFADSAHNLKIRINSAPQSDPQQRRQRWDFDPNH